MTANWSWLSAAALSLGAHAAAVSVLPQQTETADTSGVPIMDVDYVEQEPIPETTGDPEAVADEGSDESPPEPRQTPRPMAKRPPRGPSAAGQVLAAEGDDAGAVADFTMVQGSADSYVGGVTSSRGRSKTPVRSTMRPKGTPGGKGVRRGQPDRSRPAKPAAPSWSCSHLFPTAANESDVHHALVTIVVEVSRRGTARGVRVISDPGHGFGAAARTCAMGQGYVAALNTNGAAVNGFTAPFSVRFTR